MLMKDELFDAQLTRALGYASAGGSDVGECLSTAARIRRTDTDLWHDEWLATAHRVRGDADRAAAAGQTVSARGAYLRAATYFRTAGVFLLDAPVDARLVEAHRLEVESFRLGVSLLAHPPRLVEIPSEDGPLPGYHFRSGADAGPHALIILTGGYDGTCEELYFSSGAAALERGYDVLAFDGPGQGAMIIDRGVLLRPDWENVITPVVDFALTLPGVDPARIVLEGLSFGGYTAPRAASGEHRLAACISDCGPYDLFDVIAGRLPGFLARQLPDGNPRALRVLARILRTVMAKPTAGWALRRARLVHATADPLDYFRLAPRYTLKGREHLIECPTFVAHAEGDDLSAAAPRLFAALTCPKEYVLFTAAEGAGSHCEATARTLYHQRAYGWLDGVLA